MKWLSTAYDIGFLIGIALIALAGGLMLGGLIF